MKRISSFLGALSCSVLFGCQTVAHSNTNAASDAVRPAYLIVSVNELHPDKMEPYKKAVRPLVQKAGGATLLGLAQEKNIEVLEGVWDFPGILLIERFESMEALKKYWYSDEYREAKKLRDGLAEANFFVAIEGAPVPK